MLNNIWINFLNIFVIKLVGLLRCIVVTHGVGHHDENDSSSAHLGTKSNLYPRILFEG